MNSWTLTIESNLLSQADAIRQEFDEKHYREQLKRRGMRLPDEMDLALHYIVAGSGLGLDPCAGFSTDFYLNTYTDVKTAGANPYWHYLVDGRREGRRPRDESENHSAPSDRAAVNQLTDTNDAQHIADAIRSSFDAVFYEQQLAKMGLRSVQRLDLALHYIKFGSLLGLDPSRTFSTAYYLKSNPDVRAANVNAFWHYIVDGRREGRAPRQESDVSSYQITALENLTWQSQSPISAVQPANPISICEGNRDIADFIRAEFDSDLYMHQMVQRNLPIEFEEDLALHYVTIGAAMGLDPSAYFSTFYYAHTNPDVIAASVNPFWHFLVAGRREGRLPNPPLTVDNSTLLDYEQAKVSDQNKLDLANVIRAEIDDVYYVNQLKARNMEIADGVDLALHFIEIGGALHLDPNEKFSTRDYLDANSDVLFARVNPFWHYIVAGRDEGRALKPSPASANAVLDESTVIAKEFDRGYYANTYPDVAAAGIDPLTHFIDTGWKEGRNPNWLFSVNDYLEAYPDVKDAGTNPFLHFLISGRGEGRVARHELGFRYEVIRNLIDVDEAIENAKASVPRVTLNDTRDRLADHRFESALTNSKGILLTVSHDDFTENVGGVQLCLSRESKRTLAEGFAHIHIFPHPSLPVVAQESEVKCLGIVINGQTLGMLDISTIADCLTRYTTPRMMNRIAIHSLLGHASDAIMFLAKAASISSGWFWIHDFSSVCAGYNLLRNDVEYCHAPTQGSGACLICKYSNYRERNVAAHSAIFDQMALSAVAPSESALELWTKFSRFRVASSDVWSHCKLVRQRSKTRSRRDAPIRIAFLGYPVAHKGWYVFRDLVRKIGESSRVEMFHLGQRRDFGLQVRYREVAVTQGNRKAMTDAVRELSIDIALVWSLWPETFCFTAYEAIAGGASVFTSNCSGNVAVLVRTMGFGRIFDSEMEMVELLSAADPKTLRKLLSLHYFDIEYSGMTADLLKEASSDDGLLQ